MRGYSEEDQLASIQLAAWMLGKNETDVSVSDYKQTGFSPSVATFNNNFGSWKEAKQLAEEQPQHVPSHLPEYYRVVAALRHVRDLGGHPVTGRKYREYEEETGVSYHEASEPFRSWTHAKVVAGVHTPGKDFYDGFKSMKELKLE